MLTQTNSSIKDILLKQKEFFATGKTKNIDFRIQQLKKLKQIIIDNQTAILQALKADLNKPEVEGFFEILVTQDINYALKHIKSWVKPQKVKTSLTVFPASGFIMPEPLGNILIIAPWNYPFSLAISPLIGAISAGNCSIIKPSEITVNTSHIINKLIRENFEDNYIAVIEGGVETSQALLEENFDHIFFTGGTKIGKIVMEYAAKNLTPVTLELGGKSPCIVDVDIDVKETAKRITWGKFINAGQTCIAPDYLLVNKNIKQELITEIKQCIKDFYGENPEISPDYARIVNEKQFVRLTNLLHNQKVIIGGENNPEINYIAPTLIDQVSPNAEIMQEEIFGPILPILEYEQLEEVINFINQYPKALALYIFSNNKNIQENILNSTSSGGVCINDTIWQVGIPQLPFGGVGDSGIGAYHGKTSFDIFTHYKSVLKKSFLFEFNLRYAPYKNKIEQMKKFLSS
jgi:aldehyde dehydrogenase (NAD+)